MKLTAHYIAVSNGGSKLLAVFRGCKKTFVTIGCIIGMNKINKIAIIYIFKNRALLPYEIKGIPSHMGNI